MDIKDLQNAGKLARDMQADVDAILEGDNPPPSERGHNTASPPAPSSQGGTSGEAVFDLGRVSRRWVRKWESIETEATEIQVALVDMQADLEDGIDMQGDDSANPLQVLQDDRKRDRIREQLVMRKRLDELGELQENLIGQVVVSIPREWLVADAPDVIDWSESGAVADWLRSDCYLSLVLQLKEARSSKN